MMTIALFVLGAIWGSFLDVVAMRYHPDHFLFSANRIGGRSRCSGCGATLRWFELIPIVSYLAQMGRCRSCGSRIHPEHFLIEILSGIIFAAVPYFISLGTIYLHGPVWFTISLSVIWIIAFWTLLLMALIDIKWQIIPDEANIMLIILGVALLVVEYCANLSPFNSFLGSYGFLFGIYEHPWIHALLGIAVGALCFGFLILITRGSGMGMGDLKLAAALGALYRFPDILVLSALAFVIGSLYGIFIIALKEKTMKSVVPFGPFIALAAATLFFFGEPLARAYFSLIS